MLEYLAELIAVNGGDIQVRDFGSPRPEPSAPYGRFGLTVLEALHLQELRGMLQGFMAATDDAYINEVRLRIQRQITSRRLIVPTPEDVMSLRRA